MKKVKVIYSNPPTLLEIQELELSKANFVEEYKAMIRHKKSVRDNTITLDEFLTKKKKPTIPPTF